MNGLILLALVAGDTSLIVDAEQRFQAASLLTPIIVNADGQTSESGLQWDARTRLGLHRQVRQGLKFSLSGDINYSSASMPWQSESISDPMPVAYGPTAGWMGTLREANIGYIANAFSVEMGLDVSHWGLGMVANNGAKENMFGRVDGGDRVLRTSFTTRPFGKDGAPVFMTLAFDGVVEDDMATLSHGQRALQGIFSTLYAGEDRRLGTYVVYRSQREADERRLTSAVMVDAFGELSHTVGAYGLYLGTESALIMGNTDRTLTYQSPEDLALLSGGSVVKLRVVDTNHNITVHLNGGYASGDANADDGSLNDFTFDKNFGVGSVLFDVAAASVETATYGLLTDPQYSGDPPSGVEAVVTGGSFRRAMYVQPVIGIKLADKLGLNVGTVMAWSTAPIAQPFYTFRAGGEPTNHVDQATSGLKIGDEFDWSMRYQYATGFVALEGGHAWLSSDMGGEGQGRVDQIVVKWTHGL